MSLRTRLILALVVVFIPLAGALTLLRGHLDYLGEVESLQRFIRGRMVDGRAVCEADPEHFPRMPRPPRAEEPPPGRPPEHRGGGPPGRRAERRGPMNRDPMERPSPATREQGRGAPASEAMGVELFAYDSEFVSSNRRAPRFPEALKRILNRGEAQADERIPAEEGAGIRVAARMAWTDGPCAVMLAYRKGVGPRWLSSNQWITAIALALGLASAVFLAAGSVVSRVRGLTQSVRRSAGERYANPVPVEGSDELTELAQAFNEASAEIRHQFEVVEDREHSLRSFVANTTHDVMIPMTVLQGHLSAMGRGPDQTDPGLLREAMEEVQYITSLLQNLSACAKLEVGQAELAMGEVDLNSLVERVVARHTPIGKQNEIELGCGLPQHPTLVRGDLTLLEQAISNLVHNAVRYVGNRGHVAVLLEVGEQNDWVLRVLDDGPGIAEDQIQQHLKRSFRGSEARTRYPQGQGLGLHIALEVVRRHGFNMELGRSGYGGLLVTLTGQLSSAAPSS